LSFEVRRQAAPISTPETITRRSGALSLVEVRGCERTGRREFRQQAFDARLLAKGPIFLARSDGAEELADDALMDVRILAQIERREVKPNTATALRK
jgi:hypothetical protein